MAKRKAKSGEQKTTTTTTNDLFVPLSIESEEDVAMAKRTYLWSDFVAYAEGAGVDLEYWEDWRYSWEAFASGAKAQSDSGGGGETYRHA